MFDGHTRSLCCAGCEAVAKTILDSGLQDYYRKRTAKPDPSASLDRTLKDALDRAARLDATPSVTGGSSLQIRLNLEGITCAACAWLAERALARTPGVTQANVQYVTHIADVTFDPGMTTPRALSEAVARVGLIATPVSTDRADARRQRRRVDAWELGVAVFSMMQAMMFTVPFYFSAPGSIEPEVMALMNTAALLVTIPAVTFSARRFFAGAWRDLSRGSMGMDVPVAVAIAVTFASSTVATLSGAGATYFDSIGMFVSLLLAARWFESGLRDRALDLLERTYASQPDHARRELATGEVERISAKEIVAGDVLLMAPGDTLAADGITLDVASEWNEAVLTGESRPVLRAPQAQVSAGAILVGAPARVRACRPASESTYARIARMTEAALASRATLSADINRLAAWIAPVSLALAIAAALVWLVIEPNRAFDVAVAVLAITCPCALALAAPTVLAGAHYSAAKNGWLIANPSVLQTARSVTHVMFDKTGTLTEGRLRLTAFDTLGTASPDECLAIACALEQGSSHPIASALLERAKAANLAVPRMDAIESFPGKGVGGQLQAKSYRLGALAFAVAESSLRDDGALWLAGPTGPLARFTFDDTLRQNAHELAGQLAARGVALSIASGDAGDKVTEVMTCMAVDPQHARARLTPEQKAAWVRELQSSGACVAFVGDGINDAPAMAVADLGIAVSGGADLARNSAGAIMRNPSLRAIPDLLALSCRLHALTRQNLAWALTYNALAIPAALMGMVTPAYAALGMALSSFLVIANALRVIGVKA